MTMLPGRAARERSGRTSRDEQKERTRERIYAAARELFKEHGYLQTRTADIAKRAGVSQGAVHAHFQSKSDILSALMVDYLEHVDAEMARFDLTAAENCLEALKSAVQKLVWLHIENMDQVSWYYGYAWIWGDGEEQDYRRLMDRIRVRFCGILEDGVARGELKPDTPIGMVVDLIRGYYRAHLRRLRFGAGVPEGFRKSLDECVEVLLGQYRTQAA